MNSGRSRFVSGRPCTKRSASRRSAIFALSAHRVLSSSVQLYRAKDSRRRAACRQKRGVAVEALMDTIVDPETPQYFLYSLPRDDFPRYLWTERPASLPHEAWTTETTHRDGQQGGLQRTTQQR